MLSKLTRNLTKISRFFLPLIGIISLTLFSPTIHKINAQEEQEVSFDQNIVSNGESLFKGNCTVCHAINDVLIGPALRDVHERQSEEWIYAFIKNSQKVIKSGDEYAVDLYNQYNQTLMTSFDFSDEELNSILTYIKSESVKEIQVAVVDGVDVGGDISSTSISSDNFYLSLGLNIFLLLILVFILLRFTNLSKKYVILKDNQKKGKLLDDEDKEIVESGFNIKNFIKSNKVVGIASFVFIAVFVKSCIDGIYTIGIQQNYQPTQPIAFSHKIHAGQYEIDCNYCHTGVNISKSANIPAVNICMNCHGVINTDKPEIQKILTAYEENRPIEWVRVHNLPDLAYFNHSQHVAVGGIECSTCHGPIEEMEVVYQYSELTMGWCINCHRESEINSKGNDYYDKLVELHKGSSKEPLKVEDIGGLECSKCHY
ncbi:MAG: c-type cytochrome [Cytophagales bacterium]|nr:MAG: cytochrome C [Rhodothermaeota bacterium MED-G18]|tara:strand:- start:13800 stop:15083 length:1284 start_codon:yes stop_codon:yes gene_type:complete